MDVTLLYNGYNLQRRRMFTLNPRNNLVSQVEIDWPDSLRHDQLSPLSKLRHKHRLQASTAAEQHNHYVDRYLSANLNINESRVRSVKPIDRHSQSFTKSTNSSAPSPQEASNSESFKLPKIGNQPVRSRSVLGGILGEKQGYLSRMLRDRLKKYED